MFEKSRFKALDWRAVDWLAISLSALVLFAALCVISEIREAATAYQHQQGEHGQTTLAALFQSVGAWSIRNQDYIDVWSTFGVALFTALLFASTGLLWWVTRQTLVHSEGASRLQLRAYVVLEDIEMLAAQTSSGVHFSLRFINSGQTPAHHILAKCVADLDIFDPTLERLPNFERGHPRAFGAIGSRGEIRVAPGLILRPEEHQAVRDGQLAIYLSGMIVYQDIFGKDRWTEVNLYVGGDQPFAGGANVPQIVSFSALARGNEIA